MVEIFGQKKTLEERTLLLVSQIKQLKNESVKLNIKPRLLKLAPREGLLLYHDYTKQTD